MPLARYAPRTPCIVPRTPYDYSELSPRERTKFGFALGRIDEIDEIDERAHQVRLPLASPHAGTYPRSSRPASTRLTPWPDYTTHAALAVRELLPPQSATAGTWGRLDHL